MNFDMCFVFFCVKLFSGKLSQGTHCATDLDARPSALEILSNSMTKEILNVERFQSWGKRPSLFVLGSGQKIAEIMQNAMENAIRNVMDFTT